MKLKNLYIGLGLVNLLSLPAQAMNLEEELQKNPNCQTVLKKIQTTKHTLEDYKNQNGQIPLSEKNRYEEYLKELVKLYHQAQIDKGMDVKEELYYISQRYF